ncbi:hypothetical protein P280DRAFT_472606 [Massarina eburnea CBS 473.64]|uniref:Uncharacterized protein n=1 Tax=Massarina eburnea CBS 473.64 TaxID=1395130 RepID=A0A6A6RPG0_9PLEO|nr:hypothetical protein P280DRAFT_472606 [Massarina eburnea CBS 473.64]
MPVEVVNHVLSYLIHPRSSLGGLTERQSDHEVPRADQAQVRDKADLTKPADSGRAFENLFSWVEYKHPFLALAETSTRCRELVESYCAHLVKAWNKFNLPFTQLEAYGQACVYPDMSNIVYRRLWLQTAPRVCVFCAAPLSNYPHKPSFGVLLACEDCFYAQTFVLEEVHKIYHLYDPSVLRANNVRGSAQYEWILRIDVEALALKVYGTRAFHHARRHEEARPCDICLRIGIVTEVGDLLPGRRKIMPAHVKRPQRQRRPQQQ